MQQQRPNAAKNKLIKKKKICCVCCPGGHFLLSTLGIPYMKPHVRKYVNASESIIPFFFLMDSENHVPDCIILPVMADRRLRIKYATNCYCLCLYGQ